MKSTFAVPKDSIVHHSLVPKNIFQNNVPCTLSFEKKCYGEESQDVSTIKTQLGTQRRLLKGGGN